MSTPAERVRRLREEGDPLARRRRIGSCPCDCGALMEVYEHDPRARGWFRAECRTCGAWSDVEPSDRIAVVAGVQ